jgi:DNA helicase IV
LIPASRVKLATESEVVASNESPIKVEQTAVAAENRKEATKSTETANTVDALAVSTASCKNIASDKDFLKLRKRMAAKENDDIMLDEARKEFRGRCYSVEQVRYLSSLFLTSASKYQFFDAAYNYVSDKNNFASLGSEIKDEHYSKRFRALIGE